MDESKRNARAAAFAETLTGRLGSKLSQRERAALAQLVHELLDDAPGNLPPQPQTVTVLMADLRGFSDLASSCDPDTLVAVLQPFFTRMTEVVHDHGGFVDKFLGDGVMALFGAPTSRSDHLHDALCCAVRMQQAMAELNEHHRECGLPSLYAGIGINSGEVMAGSFGSEDYREYTVIGDEVNLAARVETFALRGEVLLSESCYARSRNTIDVADVRRLRVKGRSGPVTLYELGAVTTPQRIEVPRVEMRASPRVPVDLPLRYRAVQDKRVLPQEREGNILNLGYDGMLAHLPVPLPLPELGEITFTLTPEPTATDHEDIYARALHQRPAEQGFRTAFAFTSVGTRGHEAVRRYVDQTLWGH
jgi:adenylate cyclase